MASRRERQRRRRRSKSGAGFFVLVSLGVFVSVLAIVALSFVGYIVSIANSAPDITKLRPLNQGQNSMIYAANGVPLGVIQSDVLRTKIPSTSIPQVMKDATVAIEDQRFYQHKGVDFEGVVRAAIRNFENKGDKVQGGSTLTMQLIKNLYSQDKKRDYKRKIREAKLAEELEKLHPGRQGKTWILTQYLNSVPYGAVGGQNAYGVQAAARVFFNKHASDLTLPEAALLAGLPQAPSDYAPYLHPAVALQRRDEVLKKMLDLGYIAPSQYATAVATKLQLHKSTYYQQRREQYFFDYIQKQLIGKYGRTVVRQGGLKVYTTLDFRLQKLARAAIAKNLASPSDPSSALVSIDPKNGQIRAMASSGDYGSSKYNLATEAERQPGSTFKMIVLMTALSQGVDINKTSYVSKHLNFVDPKYGPIDVNTDDGKPSGAPKSLFEAVVSSDNTVFQQLDLDLGPPAVTKTARAMGITSRLDSIPSEALGGPYKCCTPLEMTQAYVTINSGGYRTRAVSVTKVVFPDGHVDTSLGQPDRVKVFTDGMTHEAILAMEANVKSGTGTAAALPFCTAAGKTGTTSGFKDAWFNGMTPNLNTAVWVGFAKANIQMIDVPGWPGEMFGGNAPAAIWHDFMTSAVDRSSCGTFPAPKEPFVAQPFFGHLQSSSSGSYSSGNSYGTSTGTSPPTATGGGTGGGGGGGAGGGGTAYPPGQYQTPPQTPTAKSPTTKTPAIPPTATTTPNPAPPTGAAGAGGVSPTG